MENIRIRELRKSDTDIIQFNINRLSDLWQVSKEEIKNNFIDKSFEDVFLYMLVAESDSGQFLGNIILNIERDWFLGIDNEPWISALFVHKEFRGHGIAQKLISECENICKKNGYKSMYLDTYDAVGYYQKIGGWKTLGTDLWKGDKVTIMVKEF